MPFLPLLLFRSLPPPAWCRIALNPTTKSTTPKMICLGLSEILRRWKKGGGGIEEVGVPLPLLPLLPPRPLVVGGETERGRILSDERLRRIRKLVLLRVGSVS